VFDADDDPSRLSGYLGLVNSSPFRLLVSLQMAFGSFEVGVIQRSPVPHLSGEQVARLGDLSRSAFDLKRSLDTASETSHVFQVPALLQVPGATLTERVTARQAQEIESEQRLVELQRTIDDYAFQIYGIHDDDRRAIEVTSVGLTDGESESDEEDEESNTDTGPDSRNLVAALISYAAGSTFGRWDLRLSIGEQTPPALPGPFAPLPVYPPGMLQGSDGLPLEPPPEGYPIRIDRDGILVDDPSHADDIVRRVRDVLEVVWKDRADAIEREACEILGVKVLRDYFRRPGKGSFWDDHVSRYSKSRRKAPIYWLLQSSKKNYALWLYYHRLDKDILFKALTNYVEPKVRLEEDRLDTLRAQKQAAAEPGRGSKKLDKEIERQEEFVSELRDFADKLARAARLDFGDPERLDSAVTYDPDLNDGVVLNIAPLHELVPWKEAKTYWDALLKGEYEWSSIAQRLGAKRIADV
jgi:hypothetical protein